MVKQITYLLMFLPLCLFSAEFTASVNRTLVNLGENVTLNLTLKDASPRGQPSVDALKKSFQINSQTQLHNTFMMNGHITMSTTWKFVLAPQTDGDLVIPAIVVNTSEGVLSTAPLTVQVIKGGAKKGNEFSEIKDIFLTKEVSNAKPYKNEPVLLSIRMIAKKDLRDIQIQKIHLDNAIIEEQGEPNVYKKLVDGVMANVIEFNYLVTPLKAVSLTIPSTKIKGLVAGGKRKNAFFDDDDFEPFPFMSSFSKYEPFAIETDEITLDVQLPVADVIPWLPAKSLKIEEIWSNSQTFKEGEPFTRGLKIVAEGIKSSQLPNLNDLIPSNSSFKVYADKPDIGDEIINDTIRSYRKEQYTFIPQKSGSLTLPEVSIVWWDVVNKEKRIAKIPARTLKIVPAPENALNQQSLQNNENVAFPISSGQPKNDLIFYGTIAGLAMLLLGAILWVIILQRKITRFQEEPPEGPAPKRKKRQAKKEKLPDLNPT